jgi:ribonuclease HII
MEQLLAEAFRLSLVRGLEGLFAQAGFELVAGVDEAGRGCLAGPVVAAAVIMDPRVAVPGVDDSKALNPSQRERLADAVRRTSVAWCVAQESPRTIDRINILEATRRAMKRALTSLRPAPDCAVVDAVPIRGTRFPCVPLVRGDNLSYAVAGASILAKVTRDRMMLDLHQQYPQYGFDAHKGYGARRHREALRTYGPTPAHRLSFRSVLPRREDHLEGGRG